MKEINLHTWEEFEEQVHLLELESERITHDHFVAVADQLNRALGIEQASNDHDSFDRFNKGKEYLFRGQSDSDWKLSTTLERITDKPLSLPDYYKMAGSTKSQVETFTGERWDKVTSLHEYNAFLQRAKDAERELDKSKMYGLTLNAPTTLDLIQTPAYEYFIYLRHHGFPSPLLDWTSSPYVAAYFAFRDINIGATHASIYGYCKSPHGITTINPDAPKISVLEKNVRGHHRHFHQQSTYTICTKYRDDEIYYAPHQEVFSESKEAENILWKFNIPTSEGLKILKQLERFNINAFSLFGSEDSLMETLSIREMISRGK